MFVLIIAGIIGFSLGRVISIVLSQLLKQQFSMNIQSAKTLIVLGSGGKQERFLILHKSYL